MGVRRSYHFNAVAANRNDGIYLSNQCDIHGRVLSDYTKAPYWLDHDSTGLLSVGDRPGYKPQSASCPVDIIGGLHGYTRIVGINTSIDADDYFIQANAAITITIPAISTLPRKIVVIENINTFSGSNVVSIVRSGSDTIDGATQIDLDPGMKIMLYLDPTANSARVIANTPKFISLVDDFAPSAKTTTSATYVTMVTSASKRFSGRPGSMILNVGCRDDNSGVDEYWRADFAFRFDSGTDYEIAKVSGTFHDEPKLGSGIKPFTPAAGTHTVDLRWKRAYGSGTMKLDDWQYLQLRFLEF